MELNQQCINGQKTHYKITYTKDKTKRKIRKINNMGNSWP